MRRKGEREGEAGSFVLLTCHDMSHPRSNPEETRRICACVSAEDGWLRKGVGMRGNGPIVGPARGKSGARGFRITIDFVRVVRVNNPSAGKEEVKIGALHFYSSRDSI
jgi:hypothetical protein